MRPSSRSLKSYSDARAVLDRVLTHGPLRLDFAEPRLATTFVARANRFRVLWREAEAAAGREYASPYDHLLIRHPGRGTSVVVEPRGFDFTLTDEAGNPIQLDKATAGEPPASPHERTVSEAEQAAFLSSFLKDSK